MLLLLTSDDALSVSGGGLTLCRSVYRCEGGGRGLAEQIEPACSRYLLGLVLVATLSFGHHVVLSVVAAVRRVATEFCLAVGILFAAVIDF